uniref:Uncharacterized protein n=1 Tax=Guillardia theta TaxID=55529 RepID=A0A7S4M048_GUITH|mmetsp:Transcript_12134/g.42291  ORF Transcript_12134/g.42291 Transcript_12134/m.42291 type:complete len:105 (+) Transcript_12134:340-654(+)
MGSTKITDCQCGTGSYLLPDDGYCMPCYSASPLLCPAGLHSFEGVTDLELCLCPVGYYKDVYLWACNDQEQPWRRLRSLSYSEAYALDKACNRCPAFTASAAGS